MAIARIVVETTREVVELEGRLEAPLIFLGTHEPGDDIERDAVGETEIGRDVSLQGPLEVVAVSKVDFDLGNVTDVFPGGLESAVDEVGETRVGEEHASRNAGIGSAELFIEIAKQLKEQRGLVRVA